MDTKIDNFWTSFGTILEPILEPKNHQKMDKKEDPFWTKKKEPGKPLPVANGGDGGTPIATGSAGFIIKNTADNLARITIGNFMCHSGCHVMMLVIFTKINR